MMLKDMIPEIKIRHKYTRGGSKGYDGFSRILIQLANEKVYDRRAAKGRGENDMDTDAVDTEARQSREPSANATVIDAHGAPPGLTGVPVSCYTGSFPAWTDDDDDDDDVDDDDDSPKG